MCVVDDPEQAGDGLAAWVEVGVPGVTILDSTELGHHIAGLGAPDDAPIFPSLEHLLRAREESQRTLMAVIYDPQIIERLVEETERIAGPLDAADTGMLFVVPVERAWGRSSPRRDRRRGSQPMWRITASPNSEHLTSVP